MTAFKRTLLFVHRWLGFISGLIVFIVSITGCIFCFQDEIQDAIHDYRTVPVSNAPFLKPSVLKAKGLEFLPKGKFAGLIYNGPGRAALVGVTDSAGYHNLYTNPYTGKILADDLLQKNFFIIVEYIHLYLLLPTEIGKMVVGISVLIFVVLMITGIVLWWPKRKTDRKRSFTIKWNGRWRRINYDLHNVLGFYAASIAIILAITGLSMSFEWVENGIYNAGNIGSKVKHADEKKLFKSDSVSKAVNPKAPAIDIAYETMKERSPGSEMILFYGAVAPGDALYGGAYPKELHYAYNDAYQFDQYSGKLLQYLPNSEKSPGLKLENMNYDIHVGQIAGLPGKIIAFIASLISASLPVTGFIIWLGKRKKKPKAKKIREISHKKSHRHLTEAALNTAEGEQL
jgi:uncharacterized iron-regulated membrane protein